MTIGVMIGHFEPLHLGHLQDINHAAALVSHLHIVITPRATPHPRFAATLQDKARWVQVACQHFDFVTVHTTQSLNLDIDGSYDEHLIISDHILASLHLSKALFFVQASSSFINHTKHRVHTLQPTPFDSGDIFYHTIERFYDIAPSARSHYIQTVCIIGGESSGKTTLVHKLANHFGATYALEMGRLYTHSDLGGTEVGLQYNDYPHIAADHLHAIETACKHASAPIVMVDTDFVTTQAFCQTYEGKSHPFLSSCIDTFKMNHTIMLANNTPWIADGMRSLGTNDKRHAFANTLISIMQAHNITPYLIDHPDYHEQYMQAVSFIYQTVLAQQPS